MDERGRDTDSDGSDGLVELADEHFDYDDLRAKIRKRFKELSALGDTAGTLI